MSHAAERRKAAVHRYDGAVDKCRTRATEPDQGCDQVFRDAKAPGGRMRENVLTTRGERPIRIEQQRTVLFTDEKAGCNGINPQSRTVPPRQFNRQPARQVFDGGLGGAVAGDPCQWTLRCH